MVRPLPHPNSKPPLSGLETGWKSFGSLREADIRLQKGGGDGSNIQSRSQNHHIHRVNGAQSWKKVEKKRKESGKVEKVKV